MNNLSHFATSATVAAASVALLALAMMRNHRKQALLRRAGRHLDNLLNVSRGRRSEDQSV